MIEVYFHYFYGNCQFNLLPNTSGFGRFFTPETEPRQGACGRRQELNRTFVYARSLIQPAGCGIVKSTIKTIGRGHL